MKLNNDEMDYDFNYLEQCNMCGTTENLENGVEITIHEGYTRSEHYFICEKCHKIIKEQLSKR